MPHVGASYRPSWKSLSKYSVYWNYFISCLINFDFKSLNASIKYLFFNKLPQKDFIVTTEMGKFSIRKNTMDFQFVNSAYEKEVKTYMLKHINDFDVFIDAGACIGEYSIWLASMGKTCIAFEPVNYTALQKNIGLNPSIKNKIKVFSCGLSDEKKKVYFNITKNPGASHIERHNIGDKTANVELDTLDNLYKSFNLYPETRVLLKFDVEGMEPEAFAGAKEFINNTKNLSIIYEHYLLDNGRNDKCLLAIDDFTFDNIDKVNRIAIKK